jgi:hypothetical protein
MRGTNWIAQIREDHRRKLELEENAKREAKIDERETRREERESHNLRLNKRLAIFAGLAALAAVWQGFESHRATKEAQRNFETTREDAKQSAAQARQDALDTINKQIEASRELRDQAARSANAAESTTTIAAQSFHVSERAYVYITPLLGRPVAARQQTLLAVALANGGHTPALKITAHTCLIASKYPETTKQAHERAFTPQGGGATAEPPSIPPGKNFEQHLDSRLPLTDTEFEELSQGKETMYLFSAVTYRDIFGKLHHEEICGFLDTNLKQFNTCNEFNKSD